ncbi:hypothetical protein A4X06_0g9094 [Tilletia controversa]|uniref:FHA domain-containing protein n=1 Tax=Tilletia controversa TaxID=13291 RepID=A0A8X7SSF5_9BASI|nr:hypothetical protein A4X06_0g9094 [Tilletia controversa]
MSLFARSRRVELRLSPVPSGAAFASKTLCFGPSLPTTIELDGYVGDTPLPESDNAIFPSIGLAIDQAFISYDAPFFTLRSHNRQSDNIRVNGRLLYNRAHTLRQGDVLEFGEYVRNDKTFKIECAARARMVLPLGSGPAPTGTNWVGVRNLVDSIRRTTTLAAGRPGSQHTMSDGDTTAAHPLRVDAMPAMRPSMETALHRVPTSVLTSVLRSPKSSDVPVSVCASCSTTAASSTPPIPSVASQGVPFASLPSSQPDIVLSNLHSASGSPGSLPVANHSSSPVSTSYGAIVRTLRSVATTSPLEPTSQSSEAPTVQVINGTGSRPSRVADTTDATAVDSALLAL